MLKIPVRRSGFFDVWRLRKSPHLGKLRVTLHFIQVTFHGYHPKKLCAVRKRLSRKSIKNLSVGLRSLVSASLSIPTCVNLLFTTLITTIPITRKMAVTGNCFVSIATIMSIRNIPKRISMVRPLSQGKMRRKMSVKRSTTHSLT